MTVTHQCVIIREPRRIREEEVRRGERRGSRGGRKRAGGDTTQIHITGRAVSTTRVGYAEHSHRNILKRAEARIIKNVYHKNNGV